MIILLIDNFVSTVFIYVSIAILITLIVVPYFRLSFTFIEVKSLLSFLISTVNIYLYFFIILYICRI